MGLADFVTQLLPKRWKDKFDQPDDAAGEIRRLPHVGPMRLGGPSINGDESVVLTGELPGGSPDRMSGVASSQIAPAVNPGPGYPSKSDQYRAFEQRALAQMGATSSSVDNQIRPSLERTDTDVSPDTLPQPITPGPSLESMPSAPWRVSNKINPSLPGAPESPATTSDYPSRPSTPSALSGMGAPPPEMEWNPLVTDPKSGKPSISPTAQGNAVDIATRERDALQRWKPKRKRSLGNTAEGAWEGFRAGGIPGAIFGGVGSLIKPSLAGMSERRRLLDEANVNVDRSQREAENQAQIDSSIIRPQLEQQRIDLAGRKDQESRERDAVQESLKLHAGIPFDPSDPNDADLLTRANRLGIRVPTKYANIKPNAREHNPLIVELKNDDGSTTRKMSRDYGVTWETVEGLGDASPPVKPTDDNATRASWFYKQQKEQESAASQLRQQAAAIVPRVDEKGTYPLDDSQKAIKDDLLQRARAADANALRFRGDGDKATTEAKPASRGGLTIEGATAAFEKKNGRKPNSDEVARMRAAMGQ